VCACVFCMYVCVCVCIYIYIYTYIYTHEGSDAQSASQSQKATEEQAVDDEIAHLVAKVETRKRRRDFMVSLAYIYINRRRD